MYTYLLTDHVLLSPSAGVMSPPSPPCEVNKGNLLENYNYMLIKNPIDVKIINKMLGNLWMYHNHTNRVCIYTIQIVINKQLFPCKYWFNGTYKYTVSFTPLKYAVGLLKCIPCLCIVYKPRNIPCGLWPSVNVQHCSFILIFVF